MTDGLEESGWGWLESDLDDWLAAVLLMTRGRLTKPPDDARAPYNEWAREHADPAELDAAVIEVRAMTPAQRGEFVRPFLGDFDA
jgi:hypothetical protein